MALPPQVWQGIQLINQEDYFEAHEILEEAWRETTSPLRGLYQGLLQAAVVAYHIEQGNWRGALKVYHRAMRHLRPWPPTVEGIDVDDLRRQLDQLAQQLKEVLLHGSSPAWPHPLLQVRYTTL